MYKIYDGSRTYIHSCVVVLETDAPEYQQHYGIYKHYNGRFVTQIIAYVHISYG